MRSETGGFRQFRAADLREHAFTVNGVQLCSIGV
jgi:hypothetical protein